MQNMKYIVFRIFETIFPTLETQFIINVNISLLFVMITH